VLSVLATRGHEIIPKSPANATMIASRDAIEWTFPAEGERHLATCGNDI
jgi:hypothetical protein